LVNDPSSSFAAAPASGTDRRTDTERTVARVAVYVRRAVKLCSFTRCLYRYSAHPQWFLAAQHNICANVQQLVTRSSSGRSRNCPSHGLPFQSFPAAKRPVKSRWGLERSDVSSLYGPRRRPIAKRFLCFFESRNRCLLQQFAKHSKLMTGDIFHGQKMYCTSVGCIPLTPTPWISHSAHRLETKPIVRCIRSSTHYFPTDPYFLSAALIS